jgi:hypothetical protein
MEDLLIRFFEDLVARVSGPMKFRLILQPLMALFFATRDGLKDAREGRPSYFWAIFTTPHHRRDILSEGWKAVGKIFLFAIIIDLIYQIIVLRWLYPGEALLLSPPSWLFSPIC